MAKIDKIKNISSATSWDLGVTIHRTNEVPLDSSSIFMNIDDARNYAAGMDINKNQSGAVAYVGQQLYVINERLSAVESYVISDTAGNLTKMVELPELCASVEAVESNVRGHLNYRGRLETIRRLGEAEPHIDGLSVCFLLAHFYDKTGSEIWNVMPQSGQPYFEKSFFIPNGWTYQVKISDDWPAGSGKYVTTDGIRLNNNDYIIVYNPASTGAQLSDIGPGNIDLIRTCDQEIVARLSADAGTLSAQLAGLSAEEKEFERDTAGKIGSLSADAGTLSAQLAGLSAEEKEFERDTAGKIGSLSADVKDISVDVKDISAEVTDISSDVNDISADVKNISAQLVGLSAEEKEFERDTTGKIGSLSADVKGVSADVEKVSAGYFNTLSAIDKNADVYNDISTDNLLITDPSVQAGSHAGHDRYYLTFKYGTLVLVKAQ